MADDDFMDVVVIAENSTGGDALAIEHVIDNTKPDLPRNGPLQFLKTPDLSDLDDRIHDLLRTRPGAQLRRLDLVGHAAPGKISMGAAKKDELKHASVSQLLLLLGDVLRDQTEVRLLGCTTGLYEPQPGLELYGPVTMLALAEYLQVPVTGTLTELFADDFDENGINEGALKNGRSWTLRPDIGPGNLEPAKKRVFRPLRPYPEHLELGDVAKGQVKLFVPALERAVKFEAELLTNFFEPQALDGRGLLYLKAAFGHVSAPHERIEVAVLGSGDYLQVGTKHAVFRRRVNDGLSQRPPWYSF